MILVPTPEVIGTLILELNHVKTNPQKYLSI
jgi:hypothetical protein